MYVGAEVDSSFGRFVSREVLTGTAPSGGGASTNIFETHQRFVGTVRAKVGHPFGRFLVYGTGGFALGGLEQQVNFTGPGPANVIQFTASRGGIEAGYGVGGGAEYRAKRRLSYMVEFISYRLQDKTLNVAVIERSGGSGTGYNSTLQNTGSLLRIGANYHF